jgi:hypothetical protein
VSFKENVDAWDLMHFKDSWYRLGSFIISIFKNVTPEFDEL